jgi:hypothetical protein
VDDATGDVGEAEFSSLNAIRQPLVVDPHEMQNRRVQVTDLDGMFDGLKSQVVGGAVGDSRFDAAAGQPKRSSERMVIASQEERAAPLFVDRRATELRPPDDQRFVEQTARRSSRCCTT